MFLLIFEEFLWCIQNTFGVQNTKGRNMEVDTYRQEEKTGGKPVQRLDTYKTSVATFFPGVEPAAGLATSGCTAFSLECTA